LEDLDLDLEKTWKALGVRNFSRTKSTNTKQSTQPQSDVLRPSHLPFVLPITGTLATDITIHIPSEDCHYSKTAFPGLSGFKPEPLPS
jgi:hypothetical protein